MPATQCPEMVSNRIQIVQVSLLRLGSSPSITEDIFRQIKILHGIVNKSIKLVPPWPSIMKSLQMDDKNCRQLAYPQLLRRSLRPLAIRAIPSD